MTAGRALGDGDRPVVQVGHPAGDGQPEAGATVLVVATGEALEHGGAVGRGDPGPLVGDFQDGAAVGAEGWLRLTTFQLVSAATLSKPSVVLAAWAVTLAIATPAAGQLTASLRTREEDQVRQWYRDYLGREVGPELKAWTQLLQNGMSPLDVQATILGSDEFFNQKGRDAQSFEIETLQSVTWEEPTASQLRRWTNRLNELRGDRSVCLAYADPGKSVYVSVTGTARVTTDRAAMEAHYHKDVEAWFPKGLDDPCIALMTVDVEAAEYWKGGSSAVTQVLAFAKAQLTGARLDPGENAKVDL